MVKTLPSCAAVLARRRCTPARRRDASLSAAAGPLPAAPLIRYFSGAHHCGDQLAECVWLRSMAPARGDFANAWITRDQRARLPPHIGVIVTYLRVGPRAWLPQTVATESTLLPGEWGYFSARGHQGGEALGAMLDAAPRRGPSRFLFRCKGRVLDGAGCRAGGPKNANDPRGTRLGANALLYSNGVLCVRPFSAVAPLSPVLTAAQRRRAEVLWHYGPAYWRVADRA